MSPTCPIADLGDRRNGAMETFGNGPKCLPKLARHAYGDHLFIGEFGAIVLLAMRTLMRITTQPVPLLLGHIPHIVGLRSKKEMVWSNTGSGIATMKDTHASRYDPIGQHPRHSMSSTIFATPQTDASISMVHLGGEPQPARRRLVDFWPKAFCEWRGWSHCWNSLALVTRNSNVI